MKWNRKGDNMLQTRCSQEVPSNKEPLIIQKLNSGTPPGTSIKEEDSFPYRVRITGHLRSNIEITSGLSRQYLPTREELNDSFGLADPLDEEGDSPTKGLIQRYKNRVALYLTNSCAAYCRFCLRKRKIGAKDFIIGEKQIEQVLQYLRTNVEIREVLLTGGDPLMLENQFIRWLIGELREISHVKVLRVCSRMPVQDPYRIDDDLCAILRGGQPLFFMLHVNHPAELSTPSIDAIVKLQKAGIPVLSQSVLLKGVNDDLETLEFLFNKLVEIGVKPYHLYQANRVKGTSHFIVPLGQAIALVGKLWGNLSGLAVPIFVYNSEDGKGKIPLAPSALYLSEDDDEVRFLNYKGQIARYFKNKI